MSADLFGRMQVFCKVVECHGVRAAAISLRVSAATVSAQLSGLEQHLGVRLIDRTTRRFSVTEDGLAYHAHCMRILEEVADTEALLARSRTQPSGRLSVDMHPTIGRRLVVPHIPAYCSQYPEVQVELTSSFGMELHQGDAFDVQVRVGYLKDSALVTRPIGSVRSVVVASPEYLARYGEPRSIADLAKHRGIHCIHPKTHKIYDWVLRDQGSVSRVSLPSALASSDNETRIVAAEAGLGLAQVLTLDADVALRSGRLRVVLEHLALPPIPVQFVFDRSRRLSAKLRSFVDFMAERYPVDGALDPVCQSEGRPIHEMGLADQDLLTLSSLQPNSVHAAEAIPAARGRMVMAA